jgi:hypothetical protein
MMLGMSPASKRRSASFHTVTDAKEFLVGRILDQADREGAPLTDVERKMLYFTERHAQIDGMSAISDEFDRDYDQNAYEKKVAAIAHRAYKHDKRNDSDAARRWLAAASHMKSEDHYLTVILHKAGVPKRDKSKMQLLLFAAVLALGFGYLAAANYVDQRLGLAQRSYYGHSSTRSSGFLFIVLAGLAALIYFYMYFFMRGRPGVWPLGRTAATRPSPSTALDHAMDAVYLAEAARESHHRRVGLIVLLAWCAMVGLMCWRTALLAWPGVQQIGFVAWTLVAAAAIAQTISPD